MKLIVNFSFTREFEIPDEIKNNPSAIGDFIIQDFENIESSEEVIRYCIEETIPEIPELKDYEV